MTEIITNIEDIAEGVLSATIIRIDGKDHYEVVVNEMKFTSDCADHTLDTNGYIMTGTRYWVIEGKKVKAPEKTLEQSEPSGITFICYETRKEVAETLPPIPELGPTPTLVKWTEEISRIDVLDPFFNPYLRR